MKKWGSLYNDLRVAGKASLLFNVVFMLRRLLLAVTIVALQKYPYFQIQIILISSVFMIEFTVLTLPFTSAEMNYLELFNEVCILGVSYNLLLITDFVPNRE